MSIVIEDGEFLKLDSALESILTKEGICDYRLEVSSGASKKDGFSSKVSSIKVIGKTRNQETKILNLILKRMLKNEHFWENFPILELFRLEKRMYEKILPEYEILLIENSLSAMELYPKLYHASEDAIILENIKTRGFRLYENLRDQENLELALLECGRLHAISFALKALKPQKFEELAPRNTVFSDIYSKTLRKSVVCASKRSLRVLDPVADEEAIRKFRSYVDNIDLYFEPIQELSNEKYSIIIHGDMWSGNMMFKYDETLSQPNKICFFDFQTISLGPPVLDLTTLIYVNGSAQVYEALDHYLAMYYKSLTEHLDRFNLDSSQLYPFEVLKEQWKNFAKYSLVLHQIIAQVKSIDESNLPDVESFGEARLVDIEVLVFNDVQNEEIYRNIVRPLILHLVKEGFL